MQASTRLGLVPQALLPSPPSPSPPPPTQDPLLTALCHLSKHTCTHFCLSCLLFPNLLKAITSTPSGNCSSVWIRLLCPDGSSGHSWLDLWELAWPLHIPEPPSRSKHQQEGTFPPSSCLPGLSGVSLLLWGKGGVHASTGISCGGCLAVLAGCSAL